MESSLRTRRKAAPVSVNTRKAGQLLPDWRVVETRQSYAATDFDDTDFEYDSDQEESPRVSMGSFGYDSNSSLSTPDLPTPDNAPRAPFTFTMEKNTLGPSGPHLFRSSVGSMGSVPSAEVDLYLERSPVQARFTSPAQEPQPRPQPQRASQPESEPTPNNKYNFSPCTPKACTTLHPDVSQVSEQEIRNWAPGQVAHWMHIGGYDDSVIEKFLMNDITGTVLLTLQVDDLKELGIQSFGKRHQLIGSIDHLRTTMRRIERTPSPQKGYTVSVSPSGEVLSNQVYIPDNDSPVGRPRKVSIVGIEQVLPKPHSCSKGENCPKYKRRQRQVEILAAEFPGAVLLPGGDTMVAGNPGNPETARNLLRPTSEAEPSVAASSDVFGNMQTPRLCAEALKELSRVDPQESIRQFLNYQHVSPSPDSDASDSETVTDPQLRRAASRGSPKSSPPIARSGTMSANLRTLPKLTIPEDSESDEMTTATVEAQRTITPSRGNAIYGSPTTIQEYGPFSSARYMPSIDRYRQGTPFTEVDVPVTAIPDGPIARETSQSVPPNMQYGNLMHLQQRYPDPFMRSASTRPQAVPATAPLRRVHKDKPLTPIENPSDLKRSARYPQHYHTSSDTSLSSDPDVAKSGYMKKRKPARFLRHDWEDAHFTLRGTNLAMHKDELEAIRHSRALDLINVDDYTVACSSLGTSSKLTAAFKKSVMRNGTQPTADDAAFAFSLIPASRENEKKMLFSKDNIKSHHFAVKTRDERIDWMRELMLARALKKGKEGGEEMQVNGNFI